MSRLERNRLRRERAGTNTARYQPRTGYEALVTGSLAHKVAMRRPPPPRLCGGLGREAQLAPGVMVRPSRYDGVQWLYRVSTGNVHYLDASENEAWYIVRDILETKRTAGVVSQATPAIPLLTAPPQPIGLLPSGL